MIAGLRRVACGNLGYVSLTDVAQRGKNQGLVCSNLVRFQDQSFHQLLGLDVHDESL